MALVLVLLAGCSKEDNSYYTMEVETLEGWIWIDGIPRAVIRQYEQPLFKTTTVVVQSGKHRTDVYLSRNGVGIGSYFVKPFDRDTIELVVYLD